MIFNPGFAYCSIIDLVMHNEICYEKSNWSKWENLTNKPNKACILTRSNRL